MQAIKHFRTAFERHNLTDGVAHIDQTAFEKLQAGRILPGRSAGALNPQFAGHDFLDRKIDIGRNVADHGHGPAFTQARNAGPDGDFRAHRFDHHVHPRAPGQLEDPTGQVFFARIDGVVGAVFGGNGQSCVLQISHHQGAATGATSGLHHHLANDPGTNHHHRSPQRDGSLIHRMKSNRKRLHHTRLGKVERRAEAIQHPGRHHEVFSESPGAIVVVTGNPDHVAVLAQIDTARLAVGTGTAVNGGIKRHPITHRIV